MALHNDKKWDYSDGERFEAYYIFKASVDRLKEMYDPWEVQDLLTGQFLELENEMDEKIKKERSAPKEN